MVKQTIQIFARLKPGKSKKGQYELLTDGDGPTHLSFSVPRDANEGIINNKKELYKFSFEHVFDVQAKQDEVFDIVARPVIDNVLQGYNGTIFAYGQTGSGKTFTITGGAERYADRGIIPRSLSYIFDFYEKCTDSEFTTLISYLEIYNENGYDLLDPKHEAAKLDDLPKVTLMEDSDQNIHLRNLSAHQASNEEEALNLLFLGDTNRMIAETPMNQASTRSHCIFTIHISSRVAGSATVRRSKLHLVDLAGSERVSKTGANGVLLTEAKYINLSLHYLEQVIIALSESRRQHIPYRNSMMTSVLRDSLGGNCMTTMIANCATERANLEETISTCRFAQRVALIKNEAFLNEELDPKLMIARLKREVEQLKEELVIATGEQRTAELTDDDFVRCEDCVSAYLVDPDPEAVLSVGGDLRKIQHCFRLLKKSVLDRRQPSATSDDRVSSNSSREHDSSEVQQLRDLLQQRDNEISILVNMLKKEKARNSGTLGETRDPERDVHTSSTSATVSETFARPIGNRKWTVGKQHQQSVDDSEEKAKNKILGHMSLGRQEAYELFRRDYEHSESIEANKQKLKQLCVEAKQLGEQLAMSRNTINKLKGAIKQQQAALAASGKINFENREPTHAEMELMQQMEEESVRFKATVKHLQELKHEIEHLQHLLEMARVKMMKDFEIWWAEQTSSLPPGQNSVKQQAWRTPMMTPASLDSVSQDSNSITRTSSSSSRQTQPSSHGSRSHQFNNTTGRGTYSTARQSEITEIPLTGDSAADADIMAFIKARQKIVQQAAGAGRAHLGD